VPEQSYGDDLRYGRLVASGYAPASTAQQDPVRQVDALHQAGIAPERIYLDKKPASRWRWLVSVDVDGGRCDEAASIVDTSRPSVAAAASYRCSRWPTPASPWIPTPCATP
jgi:hypothetical protein